MKVKSQKKNYKVRSGEVRSGEEEGKKEKNECMCHVVSFPGHN